MKTRLSFLRKFLEDPGRMGSITPSSDALAQEMMGPIDWEQASTIVELGAGTGVFTRWIEKMRREDATLVAFEKEDSMREQLAAGFPGVAFHEDAVDLTKVLAESGLGQADCVVSGLPFANFPQALRDRIMQEVHAALKPGGIFIAFQYSLQMKKQFSSLFSQVSIKLVPFNLPPAFVYVCEKSDSLLEDRFQEDSFPTEVPSYAGCWKNKMRLAEES